jgi:outer membrane receptor protein involved in Fe transport
MRRWITPLTAIGALLAGGGAAGAQGTTTGAITGTITDNTGVGLEATQVEVVNVATGFRTGVLSRDGGRYFVQGLDVSPSYRVTVRRIGFAPMTRENVRVTLGQATRVDFQLAPQAAQLSAVEVTAAQTDAEFGPTRQGVATVVSDSAIRRLPQLDRDFTDLVKLSPHVTSPASGAPSAGGSFNRFNNYTIDGGNQNDRFNLGSTEGTPGGSTGGRLISPEAVKEVQVVLNPTDVRYGNFAGMLVNAVTRNGTNEFTGGAIYTFRNPSLAASEDFIKEGDLTVRQYGFQLGGPIIKDRLHFFVAPEWQSRSNPNAGPSLAGGANTVGNVSAADVETIQNITRDQYGFDPGSASVLSLENPLTNLFGRIDWQINPSNRLVLRQLVNRAEQTDFSRNFGTFNANPDIQTSGIRLTSNAVPRENKNNSTVLQLFTNFANGAANEFSVGYNTIEDVRTPPVRAPEISINVTPVGGTAASAAVTLGTEQFSPVNILEQKILEITNNFTIPLGSHNVTVGGRYEGTEFNNDFRQRFFGVYKFNSIADYQAGTPVGYSISFGNGGDIAAKFNANILSGYVQDQWAVTPNLSLTYGLRVDVPSLPDTPSDNPLIADGFAAAGLDVRTSRKPKTQALWSPRVGVNWDVTGDQTMQVRANAGVFTGQPPFVMIGNAYQNTGLGLAILNCTGAQTPAFSTDVDNMPRACLGGTEPVPGTSGTAGINLTDPDFKYPQNFVASAGFDRRLPFGLVYTLEGMYRNAVNGMFIRDLNLRGPRYVGDEIYRDRNGRVLYADTISATGSVTNNSQRVLTRIGANNVNFGEGAIYLTNQSGDRSYSLTNQLRKSFGQALEVMGAYTFMHSRDVQSLTSDRAVSNFRNGRQFAGLESEPIPTPSYFDRPHRIMLFGSYTAPWKRFGATDVSLYYEGLSGTPYTIVANGDLNGDLVTNNDPIYIPRDARDPNEITFAGTPGSQEVTEQQIAFENIIQNNDCLREQRGKIMGRNSCRSPFQHRMDFSLRQSLPQIAGQNFTVQLDIFNFLNFLNDEWGQIKLPVEAPDFPQQRVLTVRGRTAGPLSESQPTFELLPAVRTAGLYQVAPNRESNFYRMQLTFRYAF